MGYTGTPLSGAMICDLIGGVAYLATKLMDGTEGSTVSIPARSSAPASTDAGLVVRPIPTTGQSQAVAQGAPGSSGAPWWVRETNPSTSTGGQGGGSTAVDANLTSAGSSKLVGRVDINNPTTAVSVANPTTAVTVTNPSSAVDLSSGGSSRQVGTVNLSSEGSTKVIGLTGEMPLAAALTTVNCSADASLLAVNAARRGAVIQNGSTGTALLVRLSTAAVSSASPYNFQIPANGYAVIGGRGGIPLYTGAIRAKMNSTAVAGPVHVTELT